MLSSENNIHTHMWNDVMENAIKVCPYKGFPRTFFTVIRMSPWYIKVVHAVVVVSRRFPLPVEVTRSAVINVTLKPMCRFDSCVYLDLLFWSFKNRILLIFVYSLSFVSQILFKFVSIVLRHAPESSLKWRRRHCWLKRAMPHLFWHGASSLVAFLTKTE